MWGRSAQYGMVLGFVSVLLILGYLVHDYRVGALSARPMLPVNFDHQDHAGTNCTQCHHDFIDDSGSGSCYSCHKMRPELAPQMEAMFHRLCRDCHVDTRLEGEDAGPLRSCRGCHETHRVAAPSAKQ